MLLLLMPSSTDAFPFKRKKGTDGELQQQHQPGASSKGGKGKGGKRGKVGCVGWCRGKVVVLAPSVRTFVVQRLGSITSG